MADNMADSNELMLEMTVHSGIDLDNCCSKVNSHQSTLEVIFGQKRFVIGIVVDAYPAHKRGGGEEEEVKLRLTLAPAAEKFKGNPDVMTLSPNQLKKVVPFLQDCGFILSVDPSEPDRIVLRGPSSVLNYCVAGPVSWGRAPQGESLHFIDTFCPQCASQIGFDLRTDRCRRCGEFSPSRQALGEDALWLCDALALLSCGAWQQPLEVMCRVPARFLVNLRHHLGISYTLRSRFQPIRSTSLELPAPVWFESLRLAMARGWIPEGTRAGDKELEESQKEKPVFDYFSQEGRLVSERDAKSLSRALSQEPPFGAASWYSTYVLALASFADFGAFEIR